jgi:hypothetical protein
MSQILQPLTSYASGSVGDTVFARNQHGPYTRARTVPTNPNTPRQRRARRRWGEIAWRWHSILTPLERDSWTDYAAHRVVRSVSLRPTRLTGQQAHQRANVARQVGAFGWIRSAPSIYRDPQWTRPTAVTGGGSGFVLFTIDPTDEWATQNNAALVVFVGDGRPSTINFFKAPFRRAGLVRGFAVTPPAATQFVLDPWGIVPANRRWFRSYAFLADGRVSPARIQPWDDNV